MSYESYLKYFVANEKSVMVSTVGKTIDVATRKPMVPTSFKKRNTTIHFDLFQAVQNTCSVPLPLVFFAGTESNWDLSAMYKKFANFYSSATIKKRWYKHLAKLPKRVSKCCFKQIVR